MNRPWYGIRGYFTSKQRIDVSVVSVVSPGKLFILIVLLVRSRRQVIYGGEREIRTHGTLPGSTVFKTVALNRSASSPLGERKVPYYFSANSVFE